MAIAPLPVSMIDRSSMRVLDERVLPPLTQLSMHLMIGDQVSDPARQAIHRCMDQVIDQLKQ